MQLCCLRVPDKEHAWEPASTMVHHRTCIELLDKLVLKSPNHHLSFRLKVCWGLCTCDESVCISRCCIGSHGVQLVHPSTCTSRPDCCSTRYYSISHQPHQVSPSPYATPARVSCRMHTTQPHMLYASTTHPNSASASCLQWFCSCWWKCLWYGDTLHTLPLFFAYVYAPYPPSLPLLAAYSPCYPFPSLSLPILPPSTYPYSLPLPTHTPLPHTLPTLPRSTT